MLKTKIISGIFLFIFFTVSTSVLVAGIVLKEKKNEKTATEVASRPEVAGATQTILSEESVAQHSQPSDCWIIIGGRVYDVTRFLFDHPGGEGEILPYCGMDATNAFTTKGKNPGSKHSQLASSMLADYLIGKLGDVLSVEDQQSPPLVPIRNTSVPVGPLKPTTAPVTQNTVSGVILTTEEVAKYAISSDCWMIISGKVYNFTSYISQHPGGSVIIPYCGKDGTVGFQTQGGKGSHSSFASGLFTSYYIGDLGTVTTNNAQGNTTVNNNSQNPPIPLSTPQTNNPILPPAILAKYPNAVYISGKYEDEGEWEGKVNVSGQCMAIKLNSGGSISEDKNC